MMILKYVRGIVGVKLETQRGGRARPGERGYVGMAVLSSAVRVKIGTRGTHEGVPVYPRGPQMLVLGDSAFHS